MKRIIFILLTTALACSVQAQAIPTVSVLTLHSLPPVVMPESNIPVTVYYLDDYQSSMASINQQLQGLSESDVNEKAKSVIANDASQIQQAAQGMYLAYRFGIHEVPAIIINDESIVLGTNNINLALDPYLTRLNEQARGIPA